MAGLLSAQSNSAPLLPYQFEVVSIKINRSGGSSDADFLPGGRFRGRNLSVRNMIQMATMVEDNQLIGVPSWTGTASYDIDGKTVSTEPVTQERKSAVMMALLEERFSFKIHHDAKEGSLYRLEIAKGGPKLAVHRTSDRLMSTNDNGTVITMKAAKISMPGLAKPQAGKFRRLWSIASSAQRKIDTGRPSRLRVTAYRDGRHRASKCTLSKRR